MKQQDIDDLIARKKPDGVILLEIDKAKLTPGIVNGTYFLTVWGRKPWSTIKVGFAPCIYVDQPQYWGIQVIGVQSGIGLPVETPFEHTEEVTQTMGKKGVEAIGVNQTIKLEK
ncbi:MAG: hypothetical protein MPJ78_11875 [Hyphomicrobiaceae bacterium]|nr:hypothetical protein [Hyphomicrobiaceae bacterium]